MTGTDHDHAGALATLRRRARAHGRAARAAARTAVCLLKVYPMLPSRPLNWVTPAPVVESFTYPTSRGPVVGQLYRCGGRGPHPGVVVCLGVVPFGVDHPQVPRLGEALARSGFAALLYWSPAMRDERLDPSDVDDIASAYAALLARPDIDPARSGLLGTCVGGAFALLAAATPAIRQRVGFVLAYAPYAAISTLARDIASASREVGGRREPWPVDPLTRTVYLHSLTAHLAPAEAERLRAAYADRAGALDPATLSPEGQAVAPLLGALTPAAADAALDRLPATLRARLAAISPLAVASAIAAPLVVLLHDRDDVVVPVSETRRLCQALPAARYTEFTAFRHLDPTKGSPSKRALARELLRFAAAIYPLYRRTLAP